MHFNSANSTLILYPTRYCQQQKTAEKKLNSLPTYTHPRHTPLARTENIRFGVGNKF